MSSGDVNVQFVGNLTREPELRFTPAGKAVVSFAVACTPRTFDRKSNEWRDGDTTFLDCTAWNQLAENIAESIGKGAKVTVVGKLRQRSYETKAGEKRTVYEVSVDEVGPSLQSAVAKPNKTARGSGAGLTAGDDPWASSPGGF